MLGYACDFAFGRRQAPATSQQMATSAAGPQPELVGAVVGAGAATDLAGRAVPALVVGAVRFRAYYLGLFVLLPVVLALAVDVVVIYTPAGQLVPALQSYWIAIHVTGMIIAIGAYIFGAVAAVLFLLVSRYQRRTAAGQPTAAGG